MWRTLALAALVCVGVGLLYHFIDVDRVREYAERMNGGVAFALLVILPLLGFPVTVLHVVAGLRFGAGLGFGLVALSILIQLFVSYALVHVWRNKFKRWLEPVRRRIPSSAHGTTCLFVLVLPGVPFFAKNYVLPLMGVPLRIYLLWCAPIHIARCAVAVALGGQSDELTPGRIAALALYAVTLAGASWWMWRRLQAQSGGPRSAASGRKRLA